MLAKYAQKLHRLSKNICKGKYIFMSKQATELDFQKWNKWRRSLDHIRIALDDLDGKRRIHCEFLDILKKNKKLYKYSGHPFFDWTFKNCTVCLMIGIRRLVDVSSNELNLYKLLLDIEENMQQITVDNYVRSCFPHDRNFSGNQLSKFRRAKYYGDANKAFKEAFGRARKILMRRDVIRDKQIVKKFAKEYVERFVSECLVHFDKESKRRKYEGFKIRMVHECLDTLIELYNKYAVLLRSKKLLLHKQTLVSLWDEPFRLPWIE